MSTSEILRSLRALRMTVSEIFTKASPHQGGAGLLPDNKQLTFVAPMRYKLFIL
jgi:hypothetical protein